MKRAALLVIACGACASVELAPPQLHRVDGPAAGRRVHRIVALPATCGSLQVMGPKTADRAAAFCDPATLVGVDQAIRSALDFAGYVVIDAERLNAITATRQEVVVRRETIRSETHGALFEDATPREQAGILRELDADALLTARVWFGTAMGTSDRHQVVAQVVVTAASDRELVWARRCEVEIAVFGDGAAVERTARCAATGAVP